jgi:hypothetical protein
MRTTYHEQLAALTAQLGAVCGLNRGREREIAERLERLRAIIRDKH